jgi:RimJ/RimL family protein N-acetyltransferase
MFPKPADDISETEEFINSSLPGMRDGTNMQMVMTLKDTNEFLGLAGLHDVNSNTPVLGLWVKKSAHGNGYGKEAITAMYNWAKENLQFEYLKYSVDKDNLPSIKIPESLGGIVTEETTMTGLAGNVLNLLEYRIYYNK